MKRHIFLIYLHYTKLVDVMGVEPMFFITYLQIYTSLSLIIRQHSVEHHVEVESSVSYLHYRLSAL